MNRVWIACLCLISVVGCVDVIGSSPPKQCDPDRRCANDQDPVCGADLQWYECTSMADCVGVATIDDVNCDGDPPADEIPDETECDFLDPACDPACEDPRVDEETCACTCGDSPPECDPIPSDCAETEMGADGCEECVAFCTSHGPDGGPCPEECSWEQDPSGGSCPVCVCDDPPPPPPPCEPFDRDSCEATDGCEVVVGEDGCEVCQCPEDECDRMFCDRYCENGYKIEDGCATCECYEPCSQLNACDLFCETGNQVDPATGCTDSCSCLPEEGCPGVLCTLFCANGFRRDASGCEVCACKGELCATDEDCALDEHCVHSPWEPVDGPPNGQCVQLEACDANGECADGGQCGFYFREDCCPPLTTCGNGMPSCPAVCLLEFGDLP